MGLFRTVSEINGDFGRKSQISPSVLYATTEGVPLGIVYRRWGSKSTRVMGLPGGERSLTITTVVWTEYRFFHTVYLVPPMKGILLKLDNNGRLKKLE